MSRRFADNALGLGGYDEYELDPSSAYGGLTDSRYPSIVSNPHDQSISYPHHSPSLHSELYSPSQSEIHASPPRSGSHSPSHNSDKLQNVNLSSPSLISNPFDSESVSHHRQSSDHFARHNMEPTEKRLGERQFDSDRNLVQAEEGGEEGPEPVGKKRNIKKWVIIGGVFLCVAVAAVVGGVVGTAAAKKSSDNSATPAAGAGGNTGGNTGSNTGSTPSPQLPPSPPVVGGSGTSGSEVTTDLGAKFTYVNDFGGSWAYDPANPFSSSGQAQSWTPRLTEEWVWGKDIVRGVNLGGWLVTEPFIVPSLYEPYQNSTPKAIDEYTLSQAMGSDLAAKMEEHYRTFITEQDFADIAGAGLNWVRIPIGYWAIETAPGEPFLPQVSWTYFTKAITWARKYGLRIQLDFHALPGSQNGWNHSGKAGSTNWMAGFMGIVNAQRHLETIRSLTQYISQDGIKQVVPMFGLVNEVQNKLVPQSALGSFYLEAYNLIRGITGFGNGNGPIVAIHEGFLGIGGWKGYLSGADRLALDQHPYLAFGGPNTRPWSAQIEEACSWGGGTNDSQRDFGIIVGGEWSNAINDCGLWLNGVGSTPAYDTVGSCKDFDEWMNWDAEMKANVMSYTMANMDSLQNFFFWTWRIGNSTNLGYPSSPMWHYKLGLDQGWMPKDPRAAGGHCKRSGYCEGCYEFNGVFPASATGAAPTPTIAAAEVAKYPWPPASILPTWVDMALVPTLTQTGVPITLAAPAATGGMGAGAWANTQDTAGAYTTVAGCAYPDAYDGNDAAKMPKATCTGA